MNIINLGHDIKKGKYILHSRFKNVINYTNDQELVSLVSIKIGKGPNNIILTKFPEFAKKNFKIIIITAWHQNKIDNEIII